MDEARSWIGTARAAATELRSAPSGGASMAEVARVAAKYGLGRRSLANYLRALDLVDELTNLDPALAARLTTFPVAVIDALARWREFDPAEMRSFAMQADAPSARQAIAAERAARVLRTGAKQDAKIEQGLCQRLLADLAAERPPRQRHLEEAAGPQLEHHFRRLGLFDSFREFPDQMQISSLEFAPEDFAYASSLGVRHVGRMALQEVCLPDDVSRTFVDTDKKSLNLIGLIEAPQHSLLESFRRDARSLWTRWVTLSILYPVVVVVFRTETECEEVIAGLPELPLSRLGLSEPEIQSPGDFWNSSSRVRRDERPGRLRFGARFAGAIMLTTPERFRSDWRQ